MEEKKEALLWAAKKIFEEKGYRGASVREIGEAAGLGASAVAYYFGGKERLYRAAFPGGAAPEAQDGRSKILREATALFAADGYERVSVRDIAEAAGVNSAAISYYYGGKARLYREVLDRGTSMISEFVGIVEEKALLPEEILLLYGRFICRLARERPAVMRLIFWELVHGSEVFNAFVRQRLSLVMDIQRDAVQRGIDDGRFRKGLVAAEVCTAWAGMVFFYFLSRGIHREILPEAALDVDEYLEQTWTIFLEGIRAKEEE